MAAVETRKQPQQGAGQEAAVGGALPPGLKMEDASVLSQSGKKDGETKIVKEGNAGVAYSWDSSRCAALAALFCMHCSVGSIRIVYWHLEVHSLLQDLDSN